MKMENFNYYYKLILSYLMQVSIVVAISLGGIACTDTPNGSASMINLVPSTGTLSPNFSTLVLHYRLIVSTEADTLTLTPTLKGENVTVSVNDVAVESGSASQVINLNDIDGEIKVDVISESFEYNYVITIVRGTSANAYLSDLNLSQGQLSPEFEANSVSPTGYSATVPYLSSLINITATLADPSASLTINGVNQISGEVSPDISLVEGDNAIEILVTAENQVMTQSYHLDVTRRAERDFAFSTYVKATNTDAGDRFGTSVAMWGSRLVVGAFYEDSNSPGINGDQSDNSSNASGAVYVYEKTINDVWNFQTYLKPSSPANNKLFGRSVASFNNRIAVATYVPVSGQTGQAVSRIEEYRKSDSSNWEFFSSIESPTLESWLPLQNYYSFGKDIILTDKFTIVAFAGEDGSGIGINGDSSAFFDTSTEQNAGAVYIYNAQENVNLESYIKASNTGAFDLFGNSIAFSGNTLVVGAPGESSAATGINGDQTDNSAPNSGAVYIFTYDNNSGWVQQAYIKASNTEAGDAFGSSVSLSGDTLIVGAIREDGSDEDQANLKINSGAAYVFVRDETSNWSQQAYLKPYSFDVEFLAGAYAGSFSHNVFISGDTAIISEPGSKTGGGGGIFRADDVHDDELSTLEEFVSGAAYIFTRDSANQWNRQYYIKAPNVDSEDWFSSGLSSYGDNVVFTASKEDSSAFFNEGGTSDNSANNAGAAYVYRNAPFSNHNLALSVIAGGSANDLITATNIDTGNPLSNCANNCNQLVTRGEAVRLTPITGDGLSIFLEWQGDPACRVEPDVNGAITVTVLAETFCTAVFAEVDIQFTVAKSASSTADGLIQAISNNSVIASCDIGCESDTSEILQLGSSVEITATAEDGAFVAAWSGGSECQANATNLNTVTTVSMDSSKTCTALFSFPETNELRVVVDAFGNSTGVISAVNLSTSTNLEDCSTDCSTQITQGHTVQLTPVAGDELSEFLNWTGDDECSSNANEAGITTVSMDSDTYCIAVFGEIAIEDIILTISKHNDSTADGLIQGTINNVLTISCDVGCSSADSAPLAEASLVNLTATAESGAEVTSWSGDAQCQENASNDNTTTSVTMAASKSCTAQFDLIQTHQLRLTVANSFDGTGSINAFNVTTQSALDSCSSDCSQQVISGQTLRLTPINSNTSEFSHWSGDAACSANVSAEGVSEFSLTADLLCTANFTEIVAGEITLTLSKTTDNTSLDGSMSAVPAFTDQQAIVVCDEGCTSATSETQVSGSEFDIFAYPQDSFATVVEWTGDPQCAANASEDKTFTRVILTQAITCTAKFSAPL
jgi:trimeric autotransporter adhesin